MMSYTEDTIINVAFFPVPAILDMTVGFRHDGAAPTFMNILQGKAVQGEVFIKSVN